MDGQPNNTSLIVQSMVNMYLCKRLFQRYGRKDKTQPIRLKQCMLILTFVLLVVLGNQWFYFLTAPENLYSKIGATRKMGADEISNCVAEAKVNTMKKNVDLQQRIRQTAALNDVESILTHRARRLTYDSFGIPLVEYAWSFMQPHFVFSMVVQNSIFYLISLVMNLLNRDKREMQSAFKFQLIYIITVFIIETQLIVHTADRINSPTDMLDYIYPAFPIFQRRQLLKTLIIPVTLLIDLSYKQFVVTDSEAKLNRLTGWMPSDLFVEIRSKLHTLDVNPANKNLDDQLNAMLDSQKLKSRDEKYKLLLDVFRQQRQAIRRFVRLESGNITRDMRTERLRQQYLLQGL